MSDLLILTRAVHFGAVLWLFGELAFFSFILGPALRGVLSSPSEGIEWGRRLVRVASLLLAVGIASAVAWLLLEAANMSGVALAMAIDRDTLGVVLRETFFGRVWSARFAISILLGATVWLMWRKRLASIHRSALVAATLLAASYAATLAGSGHAAANAGVDRWVHLGSDAVHLLAAGAWIGALPVLVSLLRRTVNTEHAAQFALGVETIRRFSAFGMVSVGGLLLTGLVNAFYLLGSLAALSGTDYGRMLSLKIVLFVIMVALAAVNRLRLTPKLVVSARSAGESAGRSALARVRRNALLEMAGGIAIIGIVAALGITTPAVHMPGSVGAHSMPSGGQTR
ncbi:MAG: copper homeostasis membrane protein CopD [Pseudomonadota bacterium]|nr:copper homeostasis membrane protein CopD [Pseudomonadota bacterium]